LHPIFCGSLSTLLHPVLASSFPLWQDFSKRASFPIVCVDWFYKKAVSGVVKSWDFEGILRCSKILRIRRKNLLKWVLSISRDYWVYLDITLQSFKIWKIWGEFWGIETFYRSKFSPATGVRNDPGTVTIPQYRFNKNKATHTDFALFETQERKEESVVLLCWGQLPSLSVCFHFLWWFFLSAIFKHMIINTQVRHHTHLDLSTCRVCFVKQITQSIKQKKYNLHH